MEIPLLNDVLIIFALAVPVLFLCNRAGIPTIVGFLITGLLAGPHGLGVIGAVEEVEILAEIGVILLLFTVGIEFSLKNLLQVRRTVLGGGALQVVLTILAGFTLSRQFDMGYKDSLFIGFLVSLSSTAIVLKILQEKADIESPHGRSALAILIFQDIAVVPMMLLVPVLAGSSGQMEAFTPILIAKVAGGILLIGVSARWIVPYVLYQVVRTRSRELFLLVALVICFAVAWLTYTVGLSLALGAFLAGLIISESEYSHQALGNILPFRDVFTSLFFVSIGMLLDLGFLFRNPIAVLLLALAVIILKGFLVSTVMSVLGFPLRTGIMTGLALCQIGEFSFVLSLVGSGHGLLSGTFYQYFLAVSVLTMGATPFAMSLAPSAAKAISRLPLPHAIKTGLSHAPTGDAHLGHLNSHLIIVGFGFNGRNMAQAAKVANIPYVILEMNPETVKRERKAGEPIFYGDATHEAILHHARIQDARVLVIVISDPGATRGLVATARKLNPKLHIIARTRFVHEMAPLQQLGASEVIPEEFETSVEIFTRVLSRYLIPREDIDRFAAQVRAGGYEMLRGPSRKAATLSHLEFDLPDVEINTIRVSDGSPMAGKTVAEIAIRKRYGVTLVAIKRGTQVLSDPDAHTQLLAGDLLILIGTPGKITPLIKLAQESGEGIHE